MDSAVRARVYGDFWPAFEDVAGLTALVRPL